MPDTQRIRFQAALDGDLRVEQFEGRDHLVFPVVSVREMVLKQDNGDGHYLPASEIEASTPLWEGVPVTIDHTAMDANRRDMLEAHGVGRLWDTKFADNALKGDVWVDIEKSEKVQDAPGAVEAVENADGEPTLEVSTAYDAWFDPTPGEFNGEAYVGSHRGIIPEHLALLPNGTGRCSIDAGCGAPRKNKASDKIQRAGPVRHFVNRVLAAFNKGPLSHQPNKFSDELKRELIVGALREKFGDDGVWIWTRATYEDVVVFEKDDVGDEFGLFQVSYSFDAETGSVSLGDELVEVVEKRTYEPVENSGATHSEEGTMDRAAIITRLVASDAVDFTEAELNEMEDDRLGSLNALVVDEVEASEETKETEETEESEESEEQEGEGVTLTLSKADAAKLTKLLEREEDIDAVIANSRAEAESRASEKTETVKRLAQNKACPVSEKALNVMDLEDLERLEARLTGSHVGQGGLRTRASGEGDYVDRNPTTPRLSDYLKERNAATK